MPAAALLRQANRLHFDDPALEARFCTDHDQRSLRQWRLVTALGAALVVAIGLFSGSSNHSAMVATENFGRFFLVLPWFVLQLACTYVAPLHRRLQLTGALCSAAALFCHFLTECFAMSAAGRLSPALAVSLFALATQFLVALAVTVPLRTRAMGAMLLVGSCSLYGAMLAAFPEALARASLHRTVIDLAATNVGIALVLTGVAWARERLQRLNFAQQEQLTAINAELARLNAEKNEFMAIAAHDLRAPLATVGGVAEQLARDPAEAKLRPGLTLIADQSRRMLGLVNDYLGAHTLERGTLPVRLARLDLGAAARDALARHAPAATTKQQHLALGGDHAGVFVEADAALLAQVVDNFVTNALKFSPAGASVRLEVQTADGHPRARLAVLDEGPGFSAEEQATLFHQFARTRARPTGGESSHGLGLAVAKRLAEAMGGSVGCASPAHDDAPTHAPGAVFWVELPRVD